MSLTMSRPCALYNANLTLQDSVDKKGAFDLIPLDVITEVCQHLEPADILRLARTTKDLRAFLLDRHRSRHAWKTAFGNVTGLPPCPDHLSEPAYTHLAFFPECHGCFEHCDAILWELRMRCCENCLSRMTIIPELPPNKITFVAMKCLPCTAIHFKLNEKFNGRPLMWVETVTSTPRYLSSDLEEFFVRIKNESSAKAFMEKEQKLWMPVANHVILCRRWEKKKISTEADRIQLVRQERADKIRQNLEALGWTDGIYHSTCFLELPAVRKPVPLTLAEWCTISSQIVASLPEVRLAQIAENYRCRLKQFEEMLDRTIGDFEVYPGAIEFALLSPIRNALENGFNPTIDDSTSQELRQILPELKYQWSCDMIDKLASFAQQQLGPGVDRCNIVFTCTQCQREFNRSHPHMDFDTALSHDHLCPMNGARVEKNVVTRANMSESEIYEKVVEQFGPRWSTEVLQVNKEVSMDIDRLSKALGCRVSISPAVELEVRGM